MFVSTKMLIWHKSQGNPHLENPSCHPFSPQSEIFWPFHYATSSHHISLFATSYSTNTVGKLSQQPTCWYQACCQKNHWRTVRIVSKVTRNHCEPSLKTPFSAANPPTSTLPPSTYFSSNPTNQSQPLLNHRRLSHIAHESPIFLESLPVLFFHEKTIPSPPLEAEQPIGNKLWYWYGIFEAVQTPHIHEDIPTSIGLTKGEWVLTLSLVIGQASHIV